MNTIRLLNYVALIYLLNRSTAAANGLPQYYVEMRLSNYSNPRQIRPFCNHGVCYSSLFYCCDDAEGTVAECSEIEAESRCDSFFVYCLRNLNTTGAVGCSGSRKIMSQVNQNDGPLNFSQSTVLGLPNPLILNGLTETWTGVQLYIEIHDQDPNFNQIIDAIAFNITQSAQTSSGKQTLTGVLGFVTLEVDITVLCVSEYTGSKCNELDNCINVTCSGNGQCVNGMDNFTCNCSEGYTGRLCDVNIDDCVSNPCGEGGQCIDEVNGFNCFCYQGFTGEHCEINIDDCEGVNCSGNGKCLDGVNSYTCECIPGHNGPLCAEEIVSNIGQGTGPVVGGVLGAIISLILLAIIVAVTVVLVRRLGLGRSTKEDEHSGLPGDNPIYELDGGSVTIIVGNPAAENRDVEYVNVASRQERERSESAPDHEFDNPIYGDNEEREDVYSNPDARQNGVRMGSSPYHKFDNPIYGDDADVANVTYSGIYETSNQMAQRLSRGYGHGDGTPLSLTGSSELVYDQVDR